MLTGTAVDPDLLWLDNIFPAFIVYMCCTSVDSETYSSFFNLLPQSVSVGSVIAITFKISLQDKYLHK